MQKAILFIFCAAFFAGCVPKKSSEQDSKGGSKACYLASDSACIQSSGSSNNDSVCNKNQGQILERCSLQNATAKCSGKNKNGVDLTYFLYAPRYDNLETARISCDSLLTGARFEPLTGTNNSSNNPTASTASIPGTVNLSSESSSPWRPTVALGSLDSTSFRLTLATNQQITSEENRVVLSFDFSRNGGQSPQIGQLYISDTTTTNGSFFTWKTVFFSRSLDDENPTKTVRITFSEFSKQPGGRVAGQFQFTLSSGMVSGTFTAYQNGYNQGT